MKRIFTLFGALAVFAAASAQFVPTTPGTVLKYSMRAQNPETKDSVTVDITERVLSATEADGKISVALEASSAVNDMTKCDTTTCVYTIADKTTFIPMEDAENAINDMVANIQEQARAMGRFMSEEEIRNMLSGRGEISLTLSPDMPAGTKLPKKSLKINMGEQAFTFNMWEGVSQGNETITVPAGTFDCLKITYVYKITTPQSTQRLFVTDWFAPEIGSVRNISADKKGNIITEQVLQSIEK